MKSKMNLAPDVGFSRIRVFLEQAGPIMERARGEVAQTWPLAWPPLPENIRARARTHGQPAIPPAGHGKSTGVSIGSGKPVRPLEGGAAADP